MAYQDDSTIEALINQGVVVPIFSADVECYALTDKGCQLFFALIEALHNAQSIESA